MRIAALLVAALGVAAFFAWPRGEQPGAREAIRSQDHLHAPGGTIPPGSSLRVREAESGSVPRAEVRSPGTGDPEPTARALEEEAPEELPTWEEEATPDPIQLGDCALFVSLIREGLGEPVSSHVWLFRLDAPSNEDWSRGDQLQASRRVPEAGLWFRDLPPGRYRAVCQDQPARAADPPEFWVEGARTRVELVLAERERRTARVVVFDEHGRRVRELERYASVSLESWQSSPRPSWLNERTPRTGVMDVETASAFAFDGVQDPEPLSDLGPGFVLGELLEPDRGGGADVRHDLGMEDTSRIEVPVRWRADGDATWCALLVSLAPIAETLWLEDGSRPDAGELELDVLSVARPFSELTASRPWSDLELEISARYPERRPLEFTWTPAGGPLVDRFFEPE